MFPSKVPNWEDSKLGISTLDESSCKSDDGIVTKVFDILLPPFLITISQEPAKTYLDAEYMAY
jgi:hypothetical protein